MAIIIPIIIAGVMISIVSVIIELISYFDFFIPSSWSVRHKIYCCTVTYDIIQKKKKKD